MVVLPSSFPQHGCADSALLRWQGWMACVVCSCGVVAALPEGTESSLRQWRSGGGRSLFCCCLIEIVRVARCCPGRKSSLVLVPVVVVAAAWGVVLPAGDNTMGHRVLKHGVSG